MRTRIPDVILDARSSVGEQTLALANISERPYIANLLDMVLEADPEKSVAVVSTPDAVDDLRAALREYFRDEEIELTTDFPKNSESLLVETNYAYVRHLFIRAIRRGNKDLHSARHLKIETLSDLKGVEQFLLKDGRGHRTPLLRYVYRPTSRWIAARLAHTPITPNFITLMALITLPFIGISVVIDEFAWHVAAAILIQLFLVLDIIDGDLARATNRSSNFGYWFDTTVDVMHEFTVITAFGFGAVMASGNIWFALPAGVWLVSYAATHAHNLVQTAAGIPEEAVTGASGRGAPPTCSPIGIPAILGYGRYIRWALGQPEIMRVIFVAGLLLNYLEVVVLIYAAYYFYSFVRMLLGAYKQYRREELPELRNIQ